MTRTGDTAFEWLDILGSDKIGKRLVHPKAISTPITAGNYHNARIIGILMGTEGSRPVPTRRSADSHPHLTSVLPENVLQENVLQENGIPDQFRLSEARSKLSSAGGHLALKPESVKLSPCAWEYGRLCRTRSVRSLPWRAGSVRSKRAAEMVRPTSRSSSRSMWCRGLKPWASISP